MQKGSLDRQTGAVKMQEETSEEQVQFKKSQMVEEDAIMICADKQNIFAESAALLQMRPAFRSQRFERMMQAKALEKLG